MVKWSHGYTRHLSHTESQWYQAHGKEFSSHAPHINQTEQTDFIEDKDHDYSR